ncbi:unnamed protein product [Allacma fusca]|uniref:Cell division control protein n=1 Tax=Allacma fusca TaxID=39272 RepID=A0A8J2PQ52_9HEXA|nr:unnamed protein product [Allacma fusca]
MGLQLRSADRAQGKITDSFKETKTVKEEKRRNEKVGSKRSSTSDDENVNGAGAGSSKADESEYIRAKRALHLSTPVSLPCRESQVEELHGFVKTHLLTGNAGSVYISGAPGTGKTAVVQHVLQRLSHPESEEGKDLKKLKFLSVFINCMNVHGPSAIYNEIYRQLHITSKTGDVTDRIKNRIVSKTARPIVIVLDEMDQLLSGSKETLYRIFEWAKLPGSKLVLIGIANSLDLTIRHLPLLTSSPRLASPKPRTPRGKAGHVVPTSSPNVCKLMQFPPYDRSAIETILETRMIEVGKNIFEPSAVKFVAAKVAATTGDMRKALNACQMALDTSERAQRPILKATADDGFNSSSPKKGCHHDDKIGVAAISKVLGPQKDDGILPLQQKILLATLLKINKEAPNSIAFPNDGVTSAIPTASFYEAYRKVCTDKGFSWIDRGELSSICGLLEDRCLIQVTESTATSKKKLNSTKTSKGGILFQPDAVTKMLRNDPVVESIVG